MYTKPFHLSKERLDVLFKPLGKEILETTTEQKNPRLDIVVGQHGSGKDRFMKKLVECIPDLESAYRCDMNVLRSRHPDKASIYAQNPFTYTEVTNEAAVYWRQKALQVARVNHRNAILPMTPMLGSTRADTVINAFRKAGYEVNMHCLAVPHLMSMVRLMDRFEQRFDDSDKPPYWVPLSQHSYAYELFPQKVASLASGADLSSLCVYDRMGTVVYDRNNGIKANVKAGMSDRFWVSESLHEVDGIIRAARNLPWDKATRQTFSDTCQQVLARYTVRANTVGGDFELYRKEMEFVAKRAKSSVEKDGYKADFRSLLEKHLSPPFTFGD